MLQSLKIKSEHLVGLRLLQSHIKSAMIWQEGFRFNALGFILRKRMLFFLTYGLQFYHVPIFGELISKVMTDKIMSISDW